MKQFTLLAFACALFVACADDSTDDTSAAVNNGSSTGDSTSAPNTAEGTIYYVINDWLTQNPVEGVELCATIGDEVTCATTDAEGNASLSGTLTSGEVVQLRGDREGYASFLVETVVAEEITFSEEPIQWLVVSESAIDALENEAGSPVDTAKGHVTVLVNLPGPTVAIDVDAESGPNYLNPVEDIVTSGTYFAAEPGITPAGFAAFFNVAPGQAEVSVGGDYTCTVPAGRPGGDNAQVVTVEADRVTYAALNCTANEEANGEGTEGE